MKKYPNTRFSTTEKLKIPFPISYLKVGVYWICNSIIHNAANVNACRWVKFYCCLATEIEISQITLIFTCREAGMFAEIFCQISLMYIGKWKSYDAVISYFWLTLVYVLQCLVVYKWTCFTMFSSLQLYNKASIYSVYIVYVLYTMFSSLQP